MELRHLRYFVAVGSEGNFRRAAERLHVSQPALSKQISDLEDELGVRLLDRHSRGARLSASGRTLFDEAREILERVENATATTRDSERGASGVFRLGQVGFLASSFLPQALAKFREEYPKVDVKIHEMLSQEQIESLESGKIDFGIAAAHDADLPRRVGRTLLLRTRMAIVLSRRHPLAVQRNISLPDLREETLLCFSDRKQPRAHSDLVREIFAEIGLRAPRIKPVEDYESLIALLSGGHGVTMAPPFGAPLAARGLVTRPIRESGERLKIEIRAIWLNDDHSNLPRRFLEIVQGERKRASSS